MTKDNSIFHTIKSQFLELANSEKAEQMAAYMRHHFYFYGIQTPERRKVYHAFLKDAKKSQQIDWELLDRAWQQPQREWHYFVCDYLIVLKGWVSEKDLPKLEKFARSHQWWDSIDQLDEIYGHLTLQNPDIKNLMLYFAEDDNFWMRRIAINHQLGFKDKTDTRLLSQILNANLNSQEFFINKAIGWALRDYSKTNPEWVKEYVDTHKTQMATLTIREASKFLK